VRIPLSARIGFYLILAGLGFDLFLRYARGFERVVPGIGLFSVFLFPLGLTLLTGTANFQLIVLRRERAGRAPENIDAYFQLAQKLPLKARFSGLPSFGFVCALVLSWLLMLQVMFYRLLRFHFKRITVSVMERVPPEEASGRRTEPLVIRVQSGGPGLVSLNSKRLPWGELSGKLKAELGKRSERLVYVEAESDVSRQDALQAVDAARGLNAKVVLLTWRKPERR